MRHVVPTLATACAARPAEGAVSPWGGPAAKRAPMRAAKVFLRPSKGMPACLGRSGATGEPLRVGA